MKRMKKIVSLVLAMIMAFAMATTAFAADSKTYTITVQTNAADKADHTYGAYQIFKGDLSTNEVGAETPGKDKYKLSNIEWGTGIDSNKIDELMTALKESSWETTERDAEGNDIPISFSSCESAADVAEVVAKFASSDANSSKDIDTFATIVSKYLY